MCFNAIRENKILAKISEFTVHIPKQFCQEKLVPRVQQKRMHGLHMYGITIT